MNAALLRPFAIAVPLLCAGCANMNAVFRPFDVDKGKESISIDAKQRVVISAMKAGWHDGATVVEPRLVVCAEPSPDALSVLGASFGGSAEQTQQLALKLALATNESGSNIGLRTQTITILRDAMYRLCEGYLDGALSENAFERLQRRYQNAMLGLLAIEQLTGAVTPKPTVISSQAPKRPENSESSRSDGAQQSKAAAPPSTVGGGTGDAKKQPTGSEPNGPKAVTDALGIEVAKTVSSIVGKVIDADYTLETCLNYMLDQSRTSASSIAIDFCNKTITLGNTKLDKAIERATKPNAE